MTERLTNLIANLKHLPGVYLMHDKDDKIIYIGKAKDLYKRVSQYFLRPQVGKVLKMRDSVTYFETIITKNEKEAFILEMNLIQKYYPRFNILLKDDSHYPYIALKNSGDPILRIKHRQNEKGYFYYGPFPNSSSARETVKLLNKIFPLRKCEHYSSTPCLYYHLGECLAPCINKVKESENLKLRKEVISFLEGNNSEVISSYQKKMKEASEALEFEKAKEYNDILKAIAHINTKQTVETNIASGDIFAYSERNDYLSLAVLIYRKGILIGKKTFVNERFNDLEEQVSELIYQYYLTHDLPKNIYINDEKVVNYLKDNIDTKVSNISRGKILELIVTAKENASNSLDEYFMSARLSDSKIVLLESLAELLSIPIPYHIDLFDNSHLLGSDAVGALVSFINGEPNKKLYRKFNIESPETKDDYNSMKEVITRHYSRLKENHGEYPNLILVDGGLGQVHAAIEALKKIDVDILVYGLYKDNGHKTSGIIDKSGNTYEIKDKALFFLLTRMQDEVHRFAISFHKQKRNKRMSKSILDDIKGLGIKRKELLLRAYPDITYLKEASKEELSQILPLNVAELVFEALHK